MILPWYEIIDHRNQPIGEVVCGECSIIFDTPLLKEIEDPLPHYSKTCTWCGKDCGSYFHRKAA
jgi:hypothetical protein